MGKMTRQILDMVSSKMIPTFLKKRKRREMSRTKIIELAFYLGLQESIEQVLQNVNPSKVFSTLYGAQLCRDTLNPVKLSYNQLDSMDGLLEYISTLTKSTERRERRNELKYLHKKILKKIVRVRRNSR